eukprot:3941209-Prymnesium_polylepis.1
MQHAGADVDIYGVTAAGASVLLRATGYAAGARTVAVGFTHPSNPTTGVPVPRLGGNLTSLRGAAHALL